MSGDSERAVAPGVVPAPCASKVELRLSCRHLLDRDPLTKSDPSVVLLQQAQGQWLQVGRPASWSWASEDLSVNWDLGCWQGCPQTGTTRAKEEVSTCCEKGGATREQQLKGILVESAQKCSRGSQAGTVELERSA